jgi:NitT/TauT family transport system substrate-binding protein
MNRSTFLAASIAGAVASLSGPVFGQTADTVPIRIGTPGQQGNAGVYFADDLGYFKNAGLTAAITAITSGSGAAVVAAVTGGSLDIGNADLISISAAREHGVLVSCIAPGVLWYGAKPTGAIIVSKTSAMRVPRDLEGKTIGVPSIAGLSRIATDQWLEGLRLNRASVKYVEIPSASVPQAVARGTIDAALITEPTLSLSLGENRIFASPYDAIARVFVQTAWFGADDWIARNPRMVRRFAVAIRNAQRWANEHPREATAIFQKHSGQTPEMLRNVTPSHYGEVLDPAQMQPVLDAAAKYHAIPRVIAARELISASAVDPR